MKTAAVSFVEREDGKLLCCWSKRYGGWALPGGLVEEGETAEVALGRKLREETGLEVVDAQLLYEGPHNIPKADPTRASHVSVFRVLAYGEPEEREEGCPVTWFTREEFLKWSPFAPFYQQLFEGIPPRVPMDPA